MLSTERNANLAVPFLQDLPTPTRIVRVGNTLTVEVSEELLSGIGLRAGDSVDWIVMEEGGLCLVPSLSLIPEDVHDSELLHEVPGADDEAGILAGIRSGEADFAAGRTVSHYRVVAWLESWGTENELPLPDCD